MAAGALVIVVVLLALLVGVGLAVAVGVDARHRGIDLGLAVVVGLVALITFPLGPLLWLLFRDQLVSMIGPSGQPVP